MDFPQLGQNLDSESTFAPQFGQNTIECSFLLICSWLSIGNSVKEIFEQPSFFSILSPIIIRTIKPPIGDIIAERIKNFQKLRPLFCANFPIRKQNNNQQITTISYIYFTLVPHFRQNFHSRFKGEPHCGHTAPLVRSFNSPFSNEHWLLSSHFIAS